MRHVSKIDFLKVCLFVCFFFVHLLFLSHCPLCKAPSSVSEPRASSFTFHSLTAVCALHLYVPSHVGRCSQTSETFSYYKLPGTVFLQLDCLEDADD